MGIFSSLFGKKKDEDVAADAGGSGVGPGPDAGPRTWPERLAQVSQTDDWDWDWENPPARQFVNEFLTEVAPHFGNGKVKEVPDDENIDLRGTFDGAPVRFAIWMSFGSFWAIEMKSPDALAELYIERDREKIPKHKDAGDPWDEHEERRVFVAKGIFFEGDDHEIADKLDRWSKVPDSLKARILADMERLDCSIVRAHGNDIGVHQSPGLPGLADPLEYMLDCARLMADIKNDAPRAEGAAGATPAVQIAGFTVGVRLTCAFCSTLFLQTPIAANCPNCGAPPRG